MDDKIERLVRSVLEAVDARLLEVRQEVQELATHVAQRDADIGRQLHELELRIERSAAEPRGAVTGADPLAARMEQATQVLLERIEAMHQRTTIATNERFANVHAAIDELRQGSVAPAAAAPLLPALDGMNAPLRVGPITTQQPVVAPTPITTPLATSLATPLTTPHAAMPTLEHVPVLPTEPAVRPTTPEPIVPSLTVTPAAPAPAPAPAAAEPAADDGIDLSRLADLLSERLGHLNLPTRPT